MGYWRVAAWNLSLRRVWCLVSAFTRVFDALISAFTRVFDALKSAFTRVFDALWGRGRTRGLPHTRRLLNQLSFEGGNEIWSPHHGIEPGTSCLQGKRSHQLSYAGM